MRVYIDFDGTLFQSLDFPDPGKPVPGAAAFLKRLRREGHHIVIYSTRATKCGINTERQRLKLLRLMKDALDEYGMVYDEISEDKPPWDILIDDRCIRFKGSYADVADEMKEFRPLDWSACDGSMDDTFNVR